MTAISDHVDALYAQLSRLGRSVVDRRRQGLPAGKVEASLASLGLRAPSDLAALYQASDGIDSEEGDILDDLHVFPGFYWPPLEDALLLFSDLREGPDWGADWFPVFANGGGDFYAVICGESDKAGGVAHYLRGEPGAILEFRSLGTMLATFIASFEAGAFRVDGDWLEADYPRMRDIARAADPSFLPVEIG